MSEESTTLELNRRMIEADTFDEFAMFAEQFFAPNAVWKPIEGNTFEGRHAIVAAVRDYWSIWDDHRHNVEQSVDLGHGVIWGVLREHGRIKGSDAYVEARWAFVGLLIEGRCVRFAGYTDIDEARIAAERLAQERAMVEEDGSTALADVFRRLDEAMNTNDIDGVMSFFAPDAVFDTLGTGTYAGAPAIRSFFGEWSRTYAEITFQTSEIRDFGGGVSLCVVDQRGRPHGAEGQVALRYALVTTWADGVIRQQTTYPDIDEARAAAERLAQERG